MPWAKNLLCIQFFTFTMKHLLCGMHELTLTSVNVFDVDEVNCLQSRNNIDFFILNFLSAYHDRHKMKNLSD